MFYGTLKSGPPEFHTPLVQHISLTKNPSVQHINSSVQHQKRLSSTQKPLSSTTPTVQHQKPSVCWTEVFWCWTGGFCVELKSMLNWGAFGVNLRDFECWKGMVLVLNWCVELGVPLKSYFNIIFRKTYAPSFEETCDWRQGLRWHLNSCRPFDCRKNWKNYVNFKFWFCDLQSA